jgi:hypothetical protein
MAFRITGLSPEPFRHLFGLPDAALAAHGAQRWTATPGSGLPDRIEVRDALPGETLLLVNFEHQPAATPYRAAHAIFVREGATRAYDRVDEIPDAMRSRMLSLRAFDRAHLMVDAALVDGRDAEAAIARLFAQPAVEYIQAHYATRGCYAARIDRAA